MKWLGNYTQDVKNNKWVAVKFGVIVSVFAFILSFLYSTISGEPKDVAVVVAIAIGIICFPVWIAFSYSLARRVDKINERAKLKKEMEMQEKRKKFEGSNGKKVNNKKKKKLKNIEADN